MGRKRKTKQAKAKVELLIKKEKEWKEKQEAKKANMKRQIRNKPEFNLVFPDPVAQEDKSSNKNKRKFDEYDEFMDVEMETMAPAKRRKKERKTRKKHRVKFEKRQQAKLDMDAD